MRRLSKHVKRGILVISGYYVVKLLCFGVYFSPIFSGIGYHLKEKTLELVKKNRSQKNIIDKLMPTGLVQNSDSSQRPTNILKTGFFCKLCANLLPNKI